MKNSRNSKKKKVRYAVIGLGYIAQIAMLPAFRHARQNSELVALVSDDPVKLRKLGRQYDVPYTFSYDLFDQYLESGEIDAVYISLPNSMHKDFAIRAARAGIHVLCEKPMAVTANDCEQMIKAADENRVKLMIAYRLHFEKANMESVKIAQSGKLGDLRVFNSLFTMQVKAGDIRLQKKLGGGTLYDIGIYCINAARYLFRAEPVEVFAQSIKQTQKRFDEVDEMTSAVMRFPGNRLAAFTSSFGAADNATYQILGTKGSIELVNAYEYAQPMERIIKIGDSEKKTSFAMKDQFAPELIYFSDCILKNHKPEPSGTEGLADVRIIEALYHSAATGKSVKLNEFQAHARPTEEQVIIRPAVKKPELVHADSPHPE